MELDNNAHSVFLLHYHLVLVVKYRRKVFDDAMSDRAKEIFEHISPSCKITLMEWNHDVDHVHIPEIRKKLWRENLWSRSFCLITAGGAPLSVLKQYIESQGEKHR